MTFFSRRRNTTTSTAPSADRALSPLNDHDARWLATHASTEFRLGGIETVYSGTGTLEGIDGRRYGLANLAQLLATTPRRRWPATVEHHVHVLLDAGREPVPRVRADIDDLVVPRLTPTGTLADGPLRVPPTYAPQFAPDLHILAALDHPDHLSTLAADDALDAFGGWSAVAGTALANLRALRAPDHHVIEGDPRRQDSTVHVFDSDDLHGATRILLVDELLAAAAQVEAPRHGLLFAIPDRHVVAVHVISGHGIVPATQLLVDIVLTEYEAAARRFSPHLYYRGPDGRVDQLSHHDGGTLVLEAPDQFSAALGELGLLDG